MPSPATRSVCALTLAAAMLVFAGCSGDEDNDAAPAASAPALDPASTDGLIAAGLGHLDAGDTAAAKRSFKAVLALDPTNVYATYNLGYIAQLAGDTGEAVAKYTDALDTDPGFAPALYNLGILTEPADLEASVDLYRRAVATDDQFAAAYVRLGFALRHLGHEAEAQEALDRGIAIDPAMAEVPPPEYVD